MADQPSTHSQAPADDSLVAPEPNLLETTTAKDGNLPINTATALSTESVAVRGEMDVPTAPEAPIVVTEAEIAPTASSNTGASSLAEEVESLSGEIQALEAKIDRLTGNIKPVVEVPKIAEAFGTAEPPIPPVPPTALSSLPQPVIAPKPEEKTVAVNDIYSKVSQRQKEAEAQDATNEEEAKDVSSVSSIGTVGEALAFFGIVIFLILAALPFYKSFLPESTTEAMRLIGWPSAVVSLALGFLLSLFSHGKTAVKVFIVAILLFAVVLYLGITGLDRYLGPLGPVLGSVFSFYR